VSDAVGLGEVVVGEGVGGVGGGEGLEVLEFFFLEDLEEGVEWFWRRFRRASVFPQRSRVRRNTHRRGVPVRRGDYRASRCGGGGG